MTFLNETEREQISNLLVIAQTLENKWTSLKETLPMLKLDLDIALPVEINGAQELAYQDLKLLVKTAKDRKALKGSRLYAYYKIGLHIKQQRDNGKTAREVRQTLRKEIHQNSDRVYTIAIRTKQLMDALGPPYHRTFGLLSPDVIFRIKKTDWDNLCNYAADVSEKNLQALQELVNFAGAQ